MGGNSPTIFMLNTVIIFNKLSYEEKQRFRVAVEPAQSDEQKKMSDAELARRIHVTRQTINNIVNGRSDPALSRLHTIAEALEVNVRELFCE